MCTVDQLIDKENRIWNDSILEALFDNNTIKEIKKIRIPNSGTDTLRWLPENNGLFSVKSAYKFILNEYQNQNEINNSTDGVNRKSFWKKCIPPRILHFLWKCITKFHPTSDTFARYANDRSITCPFCNDVVETMHHLFFECDVSKEVWNICDSSLASDVSNANFDSWIVNIFAPSSTVTMQHNMQVEGKAGVIIWHLWKARCKLVFENVQPNTGSISNLISRYYNDWRSNSIPNTVGRLGAHYGLRSWSTTTLTTEGVEAEASLMAVRWAKKLGIRKLHLERNCNCAIKAINGKRSAVK
ncbi:uncharacterized protein LOC113359790 [Papaver somniferum]|uniref:uncharacterized protein LOC113359790 n=1 Tax=Papaver somniferum TaxID=3469 RepID=UPI000E6FE5C9|nr:uncharacterized protein LOC113359790 [Papaver somniferum]